MALNLKLECSVYFQVLIATKLKTIISQNFSFQMLLSKNKIMWILGMLRTR